MQTRVCIDTLVPQYNFRSFPVFFRGVGSDFPVRMAPSRVTLDKGDGAGRRCGTVEMHAFLPHLCRAGEDESVQGSLDG